MTFAIAGLYHPESDKVLSYCSTLSLQFLSAAILAYAPSKAAEVFNKKWAPQISETVAKLSCSEQTATPEKPADDAGETDASNK